ncbi:glycoside hydrolase family 3 C-terminal domain-containing protein [Olsenella profusa]|uniref:Glycoside hydrolase family 3 C-terminal domain-containing protein n=1 Tax=Olsenella profusa TaxID=138595 RepID=A0ABS2F106_9ACTN|nr:glycoside hydrolase family 3 C-terminal domain-containing protein [Olsenella profusa]
MTRRWLGAAGVGAVLTSLMASGTTVALQQEGEVDHALGTGGSDSAYGGTEFTADGSLSDEGFERYIAAAYEFCEREEEEGSVLLYNKDNALPLSDSERNVTAFGRGSIDPVFRSTAGGSSTNKDYQKTPVDALKDAGFNVNETLLDAYANADAPADRTVSSVGEYDPAVFSDDVKGSFSGYGDVAFVTISRFATEGQDLAMSNDAGKRMLELDDNEKAIFDTIQESGQFKKTVVLLNSVFAFELGWLEDYDVDAVLWVGNPGFYGMPGAIRVITGEVNPSGHTQATFVANSLSAPSAENFGLHSFDYAGRTPRTAGESFVTYSEGIYVGYRYYETRYEDCVLGQGNADSTAGVKASSDGWNYAEEVCFPFGFGLSYTTYEYTLDDVTYDAAADKFTASVTVENTGSVDGKASVQLYVQSPYTDYDKQNGVEKSSIQLVAYAKVDVPAGGEQSVQLEVPCYLLASYDANSAKGWILDAGDYYFAVGNGAHEALNNILALKCGDEVEGRLVDHNGDPAEPNTNAAKLWTSENADTDTKKYRQSPYSPDVEVTNTFDDADLNYWANDDQKITYLSRSDWEGTYPQTVSTLTVNDAMYDGLNMQFYKKAADAKSVSDFQLGVELDEKINFLDMKGVEFDDPKWDDFLSQLTMDDLLLNMGDSKGIKTVKAVNKPGCTIVDGPEGMNGQFKFGDRRNCTGWATLSIVAATWDPDLQYRFGQMYGEDALYASIPIAYAPATDILRSPYSGRTSEYFSEDPMLGYYAAKNVISGMRTKGLIGTIKHFFLNEQEAGRQGIATFANEQSIREIYIRAFEGTLAAGESLGVMTAYNRIGLMYAAASQGIQHILRDEWNYGGFIIDDALSASEYSSAPEMLMAGNNIFCLDTARPTEVGKLINSTDDGDLLQKVIDSNHYLYYVMLQSSMGTLSSDTVVSDSMQWWKMALFGVDGVLAALTVGAAAVYGVKAYRESHPVPDGPGSGSDDKSLDEKN